MDFFQETGMISSDADVLFNIVGYSDRTVNAISLIKINLIFCLLVRKYTKIKQQKKILTKPAVKF